MIFSLDMSQEDEQKWNSWREKWNVYFLSSEGICKIFIYLSYSSISAFWVKDKASFLLEMNIFSAS